MDIYERDSSPTSRDSEEGKDIRKGPWTDEEDATLANYVSIHGEGRWNVVALSSGLRRTGKSCRLRWLNYLRPDVRRGNITLEEQLLILQLHSQWGNRWSKIAQYLPGRTDNEIKNYWRTRVQKQAKQLKCDVNSKQFRDAMHHVWMPRLMERIQAQPGSSLTNPATTITDPIQPHNNIQLNETGLNWVDPNFTSGTTSSDSMDTQFSSASNLADYWYDLAGGFDYQEGIQNGSGFGDGALGVQGNNEWMMNGGEYSIENTWNDDSLWFLHQV